MVFISWRRRRSNSSRPIGFTRGGASAVSARAGDASPRAWAVRLRNWRAFSAVIR
jgi:hypothetical protein